MEEEKVKITGMNGAIIKTENLNGISNTVSIQMGVNNQPALVYVELDEHKLNLLIQELRSIAEEMRKHREFEEAHRQIGG